MHRTYQRMNTLWFIALLLIHIFAVKIFTSGFLPKREPFLDISKSTTTEQAHLATHRRAIILVIDALRFDFVAPNPPRPQSPFQHNVLTLPQDLSAKYPHQSFLFNTFADPPTTTLQRIKAITTGSLPTFVDAGNNLGASSIPDDSLLQQAKLAGKKVTPLFHNNALSINNRTDCFCRRQYVDVRFPRRVFRKPDFRVQRFKCRRPPHNRRRRRGALIPVVGERARTCRHLVRPFPRSGSCRTSRWSRPPTHARKVATDATHLRASCCAPGRRYLAYSCWRPWHGSLGRPLRR